jgi:hypothetical protein
LRASVGNPPATSQGRRVLIVDAEFDPAMASDTSQPVHEANLAVTQTFPVLPTGKFEEFWII